MMKNTKVVGVAAAITLLTGVAFAPSASAVQGEVPSQSVNDSSMYAGDRFEYEVTGVRTGCAVTTTVGHISKTVTAKRDRTYAAAVVGHVNTFIKAPSIAGEYTLSSMVSTSCASDAGYKRAADMSDDVTVGDELYVETGADWENVGGSNARVYGTVEYGGGVDVDLGRVKVLASVKGQVVGSAYTSATADGEFSITVAAKYLNKRGNTKVSLSLEDNRSWYMNESVVVDR